MKRVQIQLTNRKLDDVVEEMAAAAAQSLRSAGAPASDPAKTRGLVKAAIRGVLEKYVHAYDTCGLAAVCHEGTEIDPWTSPAEDEG